MAFPITNPVDFILHIDKYLSLIIQTYGTYTYGIIAVIIFCETGLVFTPFLPGDSLLFAVGAFSAKGDLQLQLIWPLLAFAVILGDTINYWNGYFWGSKVIEKDFPLIKRKHIERTQAFYAKHGGKTIILARYVPIVRTFAPFVAGIGKMPFTKFIGYSIVGGLTWVSVFILLGYFFANQPIIKHNFSLAIIGIVAISVIPMVLEIIRNHRTAPEPAAKD